MEHMLGTELLEKMQREGKKWAVITAELNGKPRICIVTIDGTIFGMDKEMLVNVLPLLKKGLDHLEAQDGKVN